MTKLMKRYFPYLLLTLPFFLLKVTNMGVWLSDTNIYFYTGYRLLQGELLYKDIFFTNFPLFPYISSFYFFLTQGNLPLFFFTASVEVILAGFLIYTIILDQEKNKRIALLASAVYLYSFIVLATSDHQTGVFFGSLLALLSYFFYTKQKLFLSGLCIACALLTKAYFLPIALSFFIFFVIKKRASLPSFLLGGAAASIITLLPSLLLAHHDLFRDVISYSLTRSQGIPKSNIIWFFLTHDSIFVLLLLWNMLMVRKRLFLGLVSIFSFLFFFLYQDMYYLYLNFCIPFLALSSPSLYRAVEKTFSLQKMIIPTLVGILLFVNLTIYSSSYRSQQKISNIQSLTQVIKKNHPPVLYGINSLTPALAYLTNTPLLDGIIDTNENIFRKGFLSKETLTSHAITQHAMLVSNGAIYPGTQMNYTLLGGIFEEKAVAKSCKLTSTFFVKPEGVENSVSLFSCGN